MRWFWPLFLLCPAQALAFCGTCVSSGSSSLINEVAYAAMSRVDGETVLTISNDVHGDTSSEFALLIPVPEVLEEDDNPVVDPEVFTRLDA